MAAKPRINVRFRPDLRERINRLIELGRVKNLTEALEEGAELFLHREEGRLKRGIPKPPSASRNGVHTDQSYERPKVSPARAGVKPRPKGSSPTPKRRK